MRNENNPSISGTEMKFALGLDLPGGLTMDDVEFEALFYIYSNRTATIPKSGMGRLDENTYIVTLDTARIGGGGRIKCQVRVEIPDANMADRREAHQGLRGGLWRMAVGISRRARMGDR